MAESPLLSQLKSPDEIRSFSSEQMLALAEEIRQTMIDTVSVTGGHLASNLGIIELTLALHRVFNLREDRLLFDVGHQCYPHKLLTGRFEKFSTLRQKDGITGFPNPRESDYDPLICGHASTSISSAVGYATAFRLQSLPHQAIAVVGDGAIGGGMCFEALNHAGHSGENVLVILNDNDMAISETVGAFSTYLTDLRANPMTQRVREEMMKLWEKLPLLGSSLAWLQEHLLDALKGVIESSQIFNALGFNYFGPIDGHDIGALERELQNLKMINAPKILHIVTSKGNGFYAAAKDPETYHSAVPFQINGSGEVVARPSSGKSYTETFVDALQECAKADEKVVAITAAMPSGTGIKTFAENFPGRFFDVGICEAHSVTFAGGLAKAGMKPILAIYSTFMQRGYDQIFHDVAIQPDTNVVFMLDRAGLVGADGPTHHGVFDIAFLRHIPEMTLMSPRDGRELCAMLKFALTCKGPVAIRYPRGNVHDGELPQDNPEKIEYAKSEWLKKGTDLTLVAYGRMCAAAMQAAELLIKDGISIGVANARFAKPLDEEMLKIAANTGSVVTIEDHVLAGGFGSAVSEFYSDNNIQCTLKRIGLPDKFIEHASPAQLDEIYGLTPEAIAAAAKSVLSKAVTQ